MQELLKELFANYYKDVYTYLYSFCHDASLSEDLASDVFLEVVKSIATFRGESDIKTWLFSIARHKWFAYLRKKKQRGAMESLSESECMLAEIYKDKGQSAEEQYQDRALVNRIYELLDAEPERTRKVVLMRMEGYSFYEIGIKHRISESSARVIDFRAKDKIRKILKKEGLSDD